MAEDLKVNLTVVLHWSTVHTPSQPRFVTIGRCPAMVTVAIPITVAHLHRNQHITVSKDQ